MKPRKNKKRRDPRYFLNESVEESINEAELGPISMEFLRTPAGQEVLRKTFPGGKVAARSVGSASGQISAAQARQLGLRVGTTTLQKISAARAAVANPPPWAAQVTRVLGPIGAGAAVGTALGYLIFYMWKGQTPKETSDFIKLAWTKLTQGEEAAYSVWAGQQREKGVEPVSYKVWKTSELKREIDSLSSSR